MRRLVSLGVVTQETKAKCISGSDGVVTGGNPQCSSLMFLRQA